MDEVVPPFRPADLQGAIRSVKPRSKQSLAAAWCGSPDPGYGAGDAPLLERCPIDVSHIDNLTAYMSTELYVVT